MGLLDLFQNGQPEEQPFGYRDISGLGGFNFGQMEKPQGIIIHHTGGGGTPEGVMETFKQRNFPAQFIMDRDGTIVRALPDGMRGQHLRPSQINGLTNSNALGIEIIAKDDNDLTDAQKASASKWLTETQSQYGIPAANVFGHGEVNNHKQATEGSSIVNAWRQANRLPSRPDLGEPAAPTGADLPMSQRTLMAYAGRDRPAALPFEAEIQAASKETGVPAAIIRAMGTQESGLNPNVRDGRSGEIGMFQVKPTTAAQPGYGVDPLDPAQLRDPAANIRFGARYLAARARDAGVQDWNDPAQAAKGLAAYNGGGDPNYAQNVFRHLNASGSAPSQVAQRRPLNPTVTAAAERGQGPSADRPARGAAITQGQMPMARRQMVDTTTPDNAGVLEFLLQQAGQGQETMPTDPSTPQTIGGLGGLGGFLAQALGGGGQQSSGGPASIEALIPRPAGDPFALFGARAQRAQQAEAEWKGKIFTAQQLVAQGMSPQEAASTINAPALGQQLALGGIKQQKEATVNSDMARRLASGDTQQPVPQQAAQQAPTVAQPPSDDSPTMPGIAKLDTGNKTVDALFGQRDAKLKEYRAMSDNMIRATTDTAKNALQARLKSIEGEIGGIDEKMKQYAPTGTMKEYVFAMAQRRQQGQPVISMEQFDQEQRKASKTELTVKNEGTITPGYQVERDAQGNPLRMVPIPGGPVDTEQREKAAKVEAGKKQAQAAGNVVISALDDVDRLMKTATLPTTGAMGARVSEIGGTAAHDIASSLNTIKANISFDALSRMRAASPTGGALGAVSDTEQKLLSGSAAALEQSQSAEQFKLNLGRLRDQYNFVIHGPQTARPDGSSPPTPSAAPKISDGARAKGPNGQVITLRNGQWVPE